MKKVNVGLTTVNPFVFEKQHLKGEMIENQIDNLEHRVIQIPVNQNNMINYIGIC